MNVAAVSTALSQGNVQQQASLSVMKMAMGTAADQGKTIAEMAKDTSKAMELSVRPHMGVIVDIQA